MTLCITLSPPLKESNNGVDFRVFPSLQSNRFRFECLDIEASAFSSAGPVRVVWLIPALKDWAKSFPLDEPGEASGGCMTLDSGIYGSNPGSNPHSRGHHLAMGDQVYCPAIM